MSRAGVRRAVGFITAAHRSYSSCTQYRENVQEARAELARAGLPDVEVTYVPDWFSHALFVEANAQCVSRHSPGSSRRCRRAELVFTAHSIPESMAARFPIARSSRKPHGWWPTRIRARHDTVYQSRSGRPENPWLGPESATTFARREPRHRGGSQSIGFVCDHVEVLYDLDLEAREVANGIGLPMARAQAVNDHPLFLDMMTDVVLRYPMLRARGPARTGAPDMRVSRRTFSTAAAMVMAACDPVTHGQALRRRGLQPKD